MGDYPSQPHLAEQQPVAPEHLPGDDHLPNGLASDRLENGDWIIKCICGFSLDGSFDKFGNKIEINTVECDQCKTWQHITCYHFPRNSLTERDEHMCLDCNPSQKSRLDPQEAASRIQSLIEPQDVDNERKVRRAGAKNHKKTKTKDLNSAAQLVNGWGSPDLLADHRNGGPNRTHDPILPKPKSNHKVSGSLSTNTLRQYGGRHRANSNLSYARETPRPPLSECPPDYFSPDFIRIHRQNTSFEPAPENLYSNIGITNLLSTWLDDQEAFAAATNGKTHGEVFMHFPQAIEELEVPIEKRDWEDTSVKFHGEHPIWPFLVVGKDIFEGNLVGELKGMIGHRDDYVQDPSYQWSKLRHPNYFIFFHPKLPIYIDARSEGTLLRYARRSCNPNMEMKTIITGRREYRFCFMALKDIPQGSEITIPWDTACDESLLGYLQPGSNGMSEAGTEYVCSWVGTNLAHFGGCACEWMPDPKCVLSNWDRRVTGTTIESEVRATKSHKRKLPAKSATPDALHATSRAASDGPLTAPDQDVEMEDSKSTSRSISRSGKSSRDVTPSDRHGNDSIAASTDMSEREKRKIMAALAYMEAPKPSDQKKKKRNSGSNVNTPAAPAFSSHERSTDSASHPHTPVPTSKRRRISTTAADLNVAGECEPSEATTPASSSPTRCQPLYCDASTQVDEQPEQPPFPRNPLPFRSVPSSQNILKRSLIRRAQRSHASAPTTPTAPSPLNANSLVAREPQSPTNAKPDKSSSEAPMDMSESPQSPVAADKPIPTVEPTEVEADVNAPNLRSEQEVSLQSDTGQSKPVADTEGAEASSQSQHKAKRHLSPSPSDIHPGKKQKLDAPPPKPPLLDDKSSKRQKSPSLGVESSKRQKLDPTVAQQATSPPLSTENADKYQEPDEPPVEAPSSPPTSNEKPSEKVIEPPSTRPRPMHLEMPPPPVFKSESSPDDLKSTPLSEGAVQVQSPLAMATPTSAIGASLPSPIVADGAPQPAKQGVKKKLTLTEYTRRKTETPSGEKSQVQNQPSPSMKSPDGMDPSKGHLGEDKAAGGQEEASKSPNSGGQ